MLLPTQQASGTAALTLVQSTLDDIEKRRAEEDLKAKGRKEDRILAARTERDTALQNANAKINEHFFNKGVVDVNEMKVQLVDRLGEMLGLERGDDQSGYGYGRALEDALSSLDPDMIFALEKSLGLRDLNISLETLIGAIKNPYGDEDEKLTAALEEQMGGGSATSAANSKILQRLKQVADPKSLEELNLEKAEGTKDPTATADAETAAERDEDIRSMEAMEKLGDVKKVQDAVARRNDQMAQGPETAAGTPEATAAALETLTALAAAAESMTTSDTGSSADDDAASGDDASATPEAPVGSLDGVEQMAFLGEVEKKAQDDAARGILPIAIDENGLYEVLMRKDKDQRAA